MKLYKNYTEEETIEFVKQHGPGCEICGDDENCLFVDTDDEGYPEGVLCEPCRHGVHAFFKDTQMLLWAATYVNLNQIYKEKRQTDGPKSESNNENNNQSTCN